MAFNAAPSLPDPTAIQTAESVTIAIGILVALAAAWRLHRAGRLHNALRLPVPAAVHFEFAHLLAAVFVFLLFPSFVNSVQQQFGWAPTSRPAEQTAPSLTETITFVMVRAVAVIALAAIGWSCHARSLRRWGLSTQRLGRNAAAALLGYLTIWPVCAGLLYLVGRLLPILAPDFKPPEHEAITTLTLESGVSLIGVLTVIGAVVLAPLAEELFFRGIFQAAIAQWTGSPWIGIGVSAALFGAIHLPQVQNIPLLIVFGAALGYAYARTGSLTLVILMHGIFNAKTLAFFTIFR